MQSTKHSKLKKFIVATHRDLGFFFAGIVLIYAISGIMMNHRNTINPNYEVEINEFRLDENFPTHQSDITTADIMSLANKVGQGDNFIKHFYSKGNLKLLFKGGSSMIVDLQNRNVTYEKISRRFIISDMVRLHYNPGSWWSIFSDIFALCLIIITVTGLFIVKGKHGLIGRGGILLIAGVLVPILFLFII